MLLPPCVGLRLDERRLELKGRVGITRDRGLDTRGVIGAKNLAGDARRRKAPRTGPLKSLQMAEDWKPGSNVLHSRPNWCNSPAAKGSVTLPSSDVSLRTTPKAGEHIAAVRREEIAIAGPCDPRASRPATTTQDLARSEPRL